MLNVTKVLTSIVTDPAAEHYREIYPQAPAALLDHVLRFAGTAFDWIGTSDALYHNVEHTTHVTLVGLHLLRGKQRTESVVTPEIWSNVVIALLCHDIGYARGLCRSDTATTLTTGIDGQPFDVIAGRSDAVFIPIHVNRGKRFVEEQFIDNRLTDIGFVNACIERIRFPVPDDLWYAQTDDYPVFFESSVRPYIAEAVRFLEQTVDGRDIVAHLDGNLTAAREAYPETLPTAANS